MPLWGNKVHLHIAIFSFIIFGLITLIPHVSPHCVNLLPWSLTPRMILHIVMSPIRAYWYSGIQLGYKQSSPSATDNLLIYNIPPLQHTKAQRR